MPSLRKNWRRLNSVGLMACPTRTSWGLSGLARHSGCGLLSQQFPVLTHTARPGRPHALNLTPVEFLFNPLADATGGACQITTGLTRAHPAQLDRRPDPIDRLLSTRSTGIMNGGTSAVH